MIVQASAPLTVQVVQDGKLLGVAELSPRQSWRLGQFATENKISLAEMLALCVSAGTEEVGPPFTVPDEVKLAEAEEREETHKMYQQRN